MTGLLHYIPTSPLLRSVVVALLLSCVGIGMLGEWLVFKIIESDIHEEIENRIKSNDFNEGLITIKISNQNSPSDFTWVEKHEFRYKGEMYDIVKQEFIKDTIYYTCIHDARESALYANLKQQIQDEFSTNPERQKQQNDLLQKIPKFYFIIISPIFGNYTYHNQLPTESNFIFLDVTLNILSPPPEYA